MVNKGFFDHSELLGAIRAKGLSITEFATRLGISKTAMDKKLSGESAWKDSDIHKAIAVLGLNWDRAYACFFTPCKSTNANCVG